MPGKVYGLVYLITNLLNGRAYVGQTVQTLGERWSGHLADANRFSYSICRAIRKYGPQAFDIQVLSIAKTKDELDDLEAIWIVLLRATEKECGYNRKHGGRGGGHTLETRAKISRLQLGRFQPQHSLETRAKMRIAQKRRFAEHPRTAETSRKISMSNKGRKRRPFTPEHCEHISASLNGKAKTESHRQKLSIAATADYANRAVDPSTGRFMRTIDAGE